MGWAFEREKCVAMIRIGWEGKSKSPPLGTRG